MAKTIAVAGKGGVGKTTLTGLMIQYLISKGKTPVLAVDADANSNLNEVLGIDVEMTLGQIREIAERSGDGGESQIPAGMTKAGYMEMMFQRCIAEEDDYDLLVMGRTQGKGCYCFVNGLLQTQVARLSPHYPYVVVDNEAGLEHISRGILPSVDALLLVSDPSRRGVQAAGRIAALADEVGLKPKVKGLIINRAPGGKISEGTMKEVSDQRLELLGTVPHDDTVYEYDCDGKPTAMLPEDSPVRQAVFGIMNNLNL